jgi:predicted DNA binding CopG/RHH family protein
MSEPKEDKGKPFPVFYTDAEAEHFLETADLSEYDFSGFKPFRFEFQAKDARVNLRLPATLLSSVKVEAAKAGIPYQRLIREFLEQGIAAHTLARAASRKKAS